jgi:WhiB family redox-sensing transcriptional regulator
MTDRYWRDSALCLQTVHADKWFPEKNASDNGAEAKRICGMCEVQPECLAFALAQEFDMPGIWGGLSRDKRRKLRKKAAA